MYIKTWEEFHPKITGWVSVEYAGWVKSTLNPAIPSGTQINTFYFYYYVFTPMCLLEKWLQVYWTLRFKKYYCSKEVSQFNEKCQFLAHSQCYAPLCWTTLTARTLTEHQPHSQPQGLVLICGRLIEPLPVTSWRTALSFKHDEQDRWWEGSSRTALPHFLKKRPKSWSVPPAIKKLSHAPWMPL